MTESFELIGMLDLLKGDSTDGGRLAGRQVPHLDFLTSAVCNSCIYL